MATLRGGRRGSIAVQILHDQIAGSDSDHIFRPAGLIDRELSQCCYLPAAARRNYCSGTISLHDLRSFTERAGSDSCVQLFISETTLPVLSGSHQQPLFSN